MAETSDRVPDLGVRGLEHMPRTACIMAAIRAINNCNGHVDVYALLPGMRNEPPERVDNLFTHTHTHLFFPDIHDHTHTFMQTQTPNLLKFPPHDSVMHFNV